ncbi:interleukin-1 receptor-like 2 isoform X2 [Pungitius pungitius]|uniref:interleukin-1 receptor-like 2 isoform X2 n=1 Tax=Pungitius pungitius TaxID=134920 RepID=UPI002E10EE28
MAAGWTLLLAAAALAAAHDHDGETDTYRVSIGHLFLLSCLSAGNHANVTWSRGGGRHPSLPPGVEVREGMLWFLPVQMSHDGFYTCEKRDPSGALRATFRVSVSRRMCPDPSEDKSLFLEVPGSLSCKQTEIFNLKLTRSVRWMKDCRPMEGGGRVTVDDGGIMRLSAASQGDSGNYTCLVDVNVDGRTYSAARSIWVTVDKGIEDTLAVKPEVVSPQDQVVVVEEGARVELECLASIGFSEDQETFMYWTVNETDADGHEELRHSWHFEHQRGMVYGKSTLSISNVRRHFLNVPISCCVLNPGGFHEGFVRLQEADHRALYTAVALGLSSSLALLLLFAALVFFRVDLVLAHRKLLRTYSKRAPDGKIYDAYVSFLPPDAPRSAETESLALGVLPEVLEKQHGYSLYIPGRDDCPGEAVHDVIAATVRRCRRLIIIISPETTPPLNGRTEGQLCYEQKVGLHDALTSNDPRVILVEVGGPVDYSRLPESMRYVRRRQGALRWRSTRGANRSFWKSLRYHMPSVPAGGRRPPSEPSHRQDVGLFEGSLMRNSCFV